MKNTTYYKRLEKLFSLLGFSGDKNPTYSAELLAYCTGIKMVNDKLEDILSDVVYENMNGIGARMMCSLLHISSGTEENIKKANIIRRLSYEFGEYRMGSAREYVCLINKDLSVKTENFTMKLSDASAKNSDILYKLGEYFNNFLPPFLCADFGGSGFDFDYWDSTDYFFDEYDRFNLSFNFLETLR